MDRPQVVILAGPNGAGKSTTASQLLVGELGVSEFVNADVIARGLSGFRPEQVASGGQGFETTIFDAEIWNEIQRCRNHERE